MCGITGLYNIEGALLKALDILEAQEKRGRDATGVAYLSQGELVVRKQAIDPKAFKERYSRVFSKLEDVRIVIGHNRLASTNLAEAKMNKEAHPFMSEDGSFALVHNGTMAGYEFLRSLLIEKGHKFSSGVDSEVFVHILEELLEVYKDKDKAMESFHKYSEGNILILFKTGELYGLPGHSFVLMKSGDGYIIASEVASLLQFANDKEAKVLIPEEDSTLLKIFMENGTPKAKMWGKWNEEYLKYEDWRAYSKTSCDFCDQYQVWCEKIKVEGEDYDRCLKCYKANKTTPKRKVVTQYYDYFYPFTSQKSRVTNKTEKGLCQKCYSILSLDSLIYCTKCSRHFCYKDLTSHDCNVTYKRPSLEEYVVKEVEEKLSN